MNPKDDGRTHINIYSQGQTELGRKLSNFYKLPIKTIDGEFCSIEGYWYWLLAVQDVDEREELRNLYGYNAKEIGRLLQREDAGEIRNTKSFRSKIKRAIWQKLCKKEINELFLNSTLPFKHYYVYDDRVVRGSAMWIIHAIEKMRSYIKWLNGREVKQETGDLFELNSDYTLGHCVSADAKMGAGIAKEFVSRFPDIRNSITNSHSVRDVAFHQEDNRRVFNLITKENYYDKPTYEDIIHTLLNLKTEAISRGIAKIGMPRISSGLDGKDWNKILSIIERVFKGTGIFVKIKYFD